MKAFLYDYANDSTEDGRSSIILFGYTEERRKCEIKLTGFDVYCDVVGDSDFFPTPQGQTMTLNRIIKDMQRSGSYKCASIG